MAESLKTQLGFEAGQAISTLATLDAGFNKYTKSILAAANATESFNADAKTVDSTLKREAKALDVVNKALIRYGRTSSKLPKAHPAIQSQTNAFKGLTQNVKAGSKQMLLSWQSVTRIFAIQTIHKAVSLITDALSDSIREAQKLEISLAEIQTIAPSLRSDLDGVADSVQRSSDAFGIAAETVAEGTYQTLSNQVADGARAFEFFSAAAELSIGAVTSADAAVNLLSSTINSYGFNASQASTISGKLFKIIELGRVRGEEFANTFGRITVLASQLGISLDEVGASIATLTISGLKYNEAATLITNTMLKLIRPTDALKEEFREMGVLSAEAGIQAFGFQGFLEKLRKSAGSSANAIGELFGRVRAIRGVLGLTADATEQYQKNLEAIAEAGSADIFAAKQLIFETNAKQVEIEINQLKNAITFDFGRTALAVINNVFQTFGGAVNVVKAVTVAVAGAAAGFTVLAAVLFPIPAAILAVGAAVAVVTANILKLTESQAEKVEARLADELAAIEKINKAESDLAESRIRVVNKSLSELQRFTVARLAGLQEVSQQSIITENFVSGIFKQQLSERSSAYDAFVTAIKGKVDESAKNIIDAEKEIANIQKRFRVDAAASIAAIDDPVVRSMRAQQKAQELINRAIVESKNGRRDNAKELFSEAEALVKIATSSARAANNTGAEFQARKQLNRLFKEQVAAQRQIQLEEQNSAKAAQKQLAVEKSRADRIKAIIKDLRDFRVFDEKGDALFPTADAAKAQARGLVKLLQKEFDAVGEGVDLFKQLDLQKQLADITRPFEDAFTREPVTLEFAFEQSIDTAFRDIENFFKANPIPVQLQVDFEGLGLDLSTATGVEDASQGLIDIQKQYADARRSAAGVSGEQLKLNTAIQNGTDFLAAFNSESDKFTKNQELLRKIELSRSGADRRVEVEKEFQGILAGVARTQTVVGEAAADAQTAIEGEFQPELFNSAINRLETIDTLLRGIGETELAKPVRGLISELSKAATAANQIEPFAPEDIQAIETAVDAAAEGVREAQEALGPGISDAAAVGASGVQGAAAQEVAALNQVRQAALAAAAAVASVGSGGGGGTETARFGRMIYRADGGFVPRGTDTVPAMLTPGEVVVNAAASRKFASQLVAMNAGRQPIYRQEGGPVTNVGDVNVTVNESSTPMATGRATAAALRREFRRGSSKL